MQTQPPTIDGKHNENRIQAFRVEKLRHDGNTKEQQRQGGCRCEFINPLSGWVRSIVKSSSMVEINTYPVNYEANKKL